MSAENSRGGFARLGQIGMKRSNMSLKLNAGIGTGYVLCFDVLWSDVI